MYFPSPPSYSKPIISFPQGADGHGLHHSVLGSPVSSMTEDRGRKWEVGGERYFFLGTTLSVWLVLVSGREGGRSGRHKVTGASGGVSRMSCPDRVTVKKQVLQS